MDTARVGRQINSMEETLVLEASGASKNIPSHPQIMISLLPFLLNASAAIQNLSSGPPSQQEELLAVSGAQGWWHGSRMAKIGIITALGGLIIVGNTFVLMVIASSVSGWSRNCRYILILLTGTDAALALPLNLYGSLALEPDAGGPDEGPLGPYCHIVAFLNSSIFASSIYSLATISLERYVAVFFPLHYRRVMSRRRVQLLIAAAWLLPPAFLFPIAIPGGSVVRVYFSRASLICNPDYASNVTYSLLLTAVIFFPCSAIVTFANLRLWLAARRQSQKLGAHDDDASCVLVPVVIVFYMCWAPCMVTILYNGEWLVLGLQQKDSFACWQPTWPRGKSNERLIRSSQSLKQSWQLAP
ncbi:D(4) dopamine receptor-like [Lissotriton helveticus]